RTGDVLLAVLHGDRQLRVGAQAQTEVLIIVEVEGARASRRRSERQQSDARDHQRPPTNGPDATPNVHKSSLPASCVQSFARSWSSAADTSGGALRMSTNRPPAAARRRCMGRPHTSGPSACRRRGTPAKVARMTLE